MSKAIIHKSGNGPLDYTIEVDGHDITSAVRGITWHAVVGNGIPRAEVELVVVDVERIEGQVEWSGLEYVPTEVLRNELERREARAEALS